MDDHLLDEHFARVPVSGDGDCWITSVLVNYDNPPSVREMRGRVKLMVESNEPFQQVMNVKKKSIREMT